MTTVERRRLHCDLDVQNECWLVGYITVTMVLFQLPCLVISVGHSPALVTSIMAATNVRGSPR